MAIKFYGGHQLNSKAKVYGTRQDFETIEVDENGDPITEASSYFLTRSSSGSPRTLYLRSANDIDAVTTTLVNTASTFGVSHNVAVHPSGRYIAVPDHKGYSGGDPVVFVYDIQDLSAPIATLSPDAGEATYNQPYQFGISMAMSDTKLFVGNDASGVPVYCYDLSDLSAAPSKIPTPTTYHGGAYKFSSDMAANSTHLFIGHSQCRNPLTSNDNQTEAGAVHVYDVETLQYQTTLYGFNPEYGDQFGSEVKATDTHLAVGAYGDDEVHGTQNQNGAVYVFDATDLSATPTKVMPLTSGHSDEFGRMISLSDTHLAVGEPYDRTNSNESGALHIYDLTDLSNPTISYGTLYAEYYGSNPLLFNDGSNRVAFYRSFANLGQPAKYFVHNIDDLNTPLWESQTEMPYAFLPAYTPASPVRYYKTLATPYVGPNTTHTLTLEGVTKDVYVGDDGWILYNSFSSDNTLTQADAPAWNGNNILMPDMSTYGYDAQYAPEYHDGTNVAGGGNDYTRPAGSIMFWGTGSSNGSIIMTSWNGPSSATQIKVEWGYVDGFNSGHINVNNGPNITDQPLMESFDPTANDLLQIVEYGASIVYVKSIWFKV